MISVEQIREGVCGNRSLNAKEDLIRGTNVEGDLGAESDLEGFKKRKQKLGLEAHELGQLVPYALP